MILIIILQLTTLNDFKTAAKRVEVDKGVYEILGCSISALAEWLGGYFSFGDINSFSCTKVKFEFDSGSGDMRPGEAADGLLVDKVRVGDGYQ